MSSANSTIIKWLLVTTLLFTFILTILTTGFIVRYEDKLMQYEERIFSLESELDNFFHRLSEEVQGTSIPDEEFEYETHSNGNLFDESDEVLEVLEDEEDKESSTHENNEPFGEVKLQEEKQRSRSKRQIPLSVIPTYGPEIERSEDGVPIIDRSYLSSAGVTLRPRLLSSVPATDSEGLRLYEGLVETGGRNEPKSTDFAHREGLRTLLPHHQVSAAWSEKSEQRLPRLELKSGDSSSFGVYSTSGPRFADELTYTRSNTRRSSSTYSSGTGSSYQSGTSGTGSSSNYLSSGNNVLVTSGSPGSTYHRNSRVPATGDYFYPSSNANNLKTTAQTRSVQYPPLRKLSVGNGEGEVIARVLQSENEADSDRPNSATAFANYGQSATAEASSTRQRGAGHRQRHRQQQTPGVTSSSQSYSSRSGQRYHRKTDASDEDSGEISVVKAEAWVEGPKPIAAHYVADVTNYTTAHKNYEGNGRLRNSDGVFASWRPSEWMTADSGDGTKNFVLSPTGVLNIKKTGLYYIYAQIHYLDEHDINGFTVQVNTEPFLQCTTMTETYSAGSKSNSCFTAGVTYLKENDRILIKDIETNRYSIFKPEKSFFGLMKMGDSNQ